jgi:beta-lactamase class A
MRRADFLALAGGAALPTPPPFARAIDADPFVALERRGARLGVVALDLGSAARLGHRGAERFPLGGLWRLPLVITVLARVDAGDDRLDRQVAFGPSDLEAGSVLARYYPNGAILPLGKLCAFALSYGDESAADLVAPLIGGPMAVTSYLRGIGIHGIRIDRIGRERPIRTDPHDPRDTASPDSMAHLLEQLGSESPLSDASTTLLLDWLRANATGAGRLRAGVPRAWTVADASGNAPSLAADAGLLMPVGAPIAIACFALDVGGVGAANAAIAGCARIAVDRFTRASAR